jgi:high affinity sulfate transporter 1
MTTQTAQPTQSKPLPQAPSSLQRWFPIGAWLPKYQWGKFLSADLIAAVSVAALLIPESMGYATVAGIPVQYGLYAAPLALIGYAMFGGSKLLVFAAAGSTAAVSASVVGGLSGGDQKTAVAMTAALAIATGVVFLVAGLARLGWIANFMSKAIMDGFITGMSIQIIVGQLGKLFGVQVADGNTFQKLWSAVSQIGDWNWTATAIGVGGLLLIFALQRFIPKLPAALTAVVLSSVIVAVVSPDIDLVAQIPQGLPSFAIPTGIGASTWLSLLAGGAVVALVGFSEGWGASANISKKTHDSLDTNQEFRAYGVGNIGAGLLGGMVVTGSLSKSAAAMTAGARTQMANVFLAGIVLLTLAFLAPLFQWLPETVLAAIVINAMWGSASPRKLERLWRIDRVDFVAAFITFFLVLALDLLPAMIAGIVLSLLYVIYRISFPGRAVLGRVAATGDYEVMSWAYGRRGGTTHSEAKAVPGVIVYRFAAPLIFSNAEAFKGTGEALLIEAAAEGALPHTLVVDFEEIVSVDTTGAAALTDFLDYAQRYGVDLKLARVHSGAHRLLQVTGVMDEIGEHRIHHTVRNAVDAATASATDGESAAAVSSAAAQSDDNSGSANA